MTLFLVYCPTNGSQTIFNLFNLCAHYFIDGCCNEMCWARKTCWYAFNHYFFRQCLFKSALKTKNSFLVLTELFQPAEIWPENVDVFALHRRVKDARAKEICCSVSTMKLACPLINAQARARTHVQMMHQAHNVRCCQYYHIIFITKRKIPCGFNILLW